MKITSNKKAKNNKKIAIIISVIAIVILAGGGSAYAYFRSKTQSTKNSTDSTKSESKVDLNPPTDEQNAAGNETKQNASDPDKTPVNNNPSTNTSVTLSITSKNQVKDIDQNIVQIRAQIATVDNAGTCTLTLSDGTTTITRTAGVQALASVSTCQGFNIDVPTSRLKTGLWSIKISYASGNITGSISDTVTVK